MASNGHAVSTAPIPSGFSYAQAIKGKPSAPSQQQQTTPAPSTTATTATAPQTVKDASTPKQNGSPEGLNSPNGIEHHNSTSSEGRTSSSTPVETSSNNVQSDVASAAANGQVKAKDEDSTSGRSHRKSSVKPEDSVSDEKAQSRDPSKARSAKSTESSKTKEDEEPKKPLKDAPLPAVNFWTQRAQVSVKPTPLASAVKSDTKSAAITSDSLQDSAKISKPSSVDASSASSAVAESKLSTKPTKPKVISVSDAVSWPTPETAQNEIKKVQQVEKPQAEKPEQQANKPHGKNEWVTMDFTPSVKFNTPLPESGRRGGRGGGGTRGGRGGSSRGGLPSGTRGGSATGGASLPPTSASSVTGTTTAAPVVDAVGAAPVGRGRGDGSFSRSSSTAPRGKRVPNGTITTHRGDVELAGRPKPAQTAEQAPQKFVQQVAPASVTSNAITVESSQEDRASAPVASDGVAKSGNGDNPDATAPPFKPFRKPYHPNSTPHPSSHVMNGDHTVSQSGTHFESSKPARSSFADRQNSHSSSMRKGEAGRSNDHPRDISTGSGGPRERGEGRPRGGKQRNSVYAPAHISTNHAYANGYQTPHPSSARSGSFPSPFPQQFQGSGRNGRGNPRSASIPSEMPSGRYSGYPEFAAQSFDGYGYPGYYPQPAPMYGADPQMVNVQPQLQGIQGIVAAQLNYYFSFENLIKDTFLRARMDSQGFVPLALIADFKRVKQITTDVNILRSACSGNINLELHTTTDGRDYVRTRFNPQQWVYEMSARHAEAQHDGPDDLDRSQSRDQQRQGAPQFYMPNFMPAGEYYPPQYGNYGQGFHPAPVSTPPVPNFPGMRSPPINSTSGVDTRMQSPTSFTPPIQNGSGSHHNHEGHDAFPDDRINELMVYTRPKGASSHDRSSQRSDHGVNGAQETERDLQAPSGSDERRSRSPIAKDSSEWDSNKKLAEIRKSLTSLSRSRSKPSHEATEIQFYTKPANEEIKKSTSTSEPDSEPYSSLRTRALAQRKAASTGHCPHDMYLLYDFWSHFLLQNFNTKLYNEFRKFAHEDATENSSPVGMNLLINFYTQSLKGKHQMNRLVAQHFVELVDIEDPGKDRPAFKKLRTAWRDGATNMRNRKLISTFLGPSLLAELDL